MTRGGKRRNAGRPEGKGPYGEATRTIRVPVSLVDEIKIFAANKGFKMPLYSSRVQAGYPSSSESHVERHVDLNRDLVKSPEDAFLVYATGDSMKDAGIRDGDLLVVDRSIPATHGKIVVAALNGETTVKYLHIRKGKVFLVPANKRFKEIPVDPEAGTVILGVVTSSIKEHWR